MKKQLASIFIATLLIACGKGNEGTPEPVVPPPVVVTPVPGKSSLSFPAQNDVCTSGTVVSETESKIVFKWAVAENTTSYELTLKNLLTNESVTKVATAVELEVTLARNTPYSWFITSKSNTESTKSDVWKFYNAGPGAITYAPFPAEIISPVMAETVTATSGKVRLEWRGSDVEGDIVGYDVYVGTTSPVLVKANETNSFLADLSVVPGTAYVWKVVTKDSKGNKSDSGVYQFTVK
ncbi:hypothetical protein [Pedobacter duraquae]|uniref:Fibronectin type-III domain-containing protein n=1 Tax=Pedobacter duraquae TaxID=425511 RepID=A0A4R6IPS4_9SPHI|nr:hypothetical protein [Pedobacter duraquae]TDO24187.1 hypothetical protein CLV32_0475 [Pedobacter duraquae]